MSVFGLPDEVVEFRGDMVWIGRHRRTVCGPLSVYGNNGLIFSLISEELNESTEFRFSRSKTRYFCLEFLLPYSQLA